MILRRRVFFDHALNGDVQTFACFRALFVVREGVVRVGDELLVVAEARGVAHGLSRVSWPVAW